MTTTSNMFHIFRPSPGAVSVMIALLALRVLSPAVVLLAALATIPLKPGGQHSAEPSDVTIVVAATRTPRRGAILSLLVLLAGTHLLDGALFVVRAVTTGEWVPSTGIDIAAPLGLVAFAGLAALGAYKDVIGVNIWETRRVKTAITLALLVDLAHTILLGITLGQFRPITKLPTDQLVHFAFAATRVLLLVPLLFAISYPRVSYYTALLSDEDNATASTSLLLPPGTNGEPSSGLSSLNKDGAQYGTFSGRPGRAQFAAPSGPTTRANTPAPGDKSTPAKEDVALDPSWAETRQRLARIIPFLWPSSSKSLQLLALGCFGLLAVGRLVNYELPYALAGLIKTLTDGTGMPWFYVFSYVGLRYLQSSGGLPALRDILWTPVMQYSDRSMSQLCFDHLLNLSLAFHSRRKTGEVLRILDRGAAINRIFELLLFNFVPILADITIALVVFVVHFEWTLAAVIFFDMAAYMAVSVILTRWRTKLRRQMNDRDVITRGIHTDCLLNYETVKYFNGEEHEGERYADAIRQYQSLEYQVITSLNILNLVQNLIIALGLLVGSLIVALRVTRGQSDASDFILFITYIAQLYGPLAMLGSIYRSVNQGLVDTEKLLMLLNEPTEVNDAPDAKELVVKDGTIEFDNVSFSYDGRGHALSGVSFTVPKGASVALVGESGSGKSTILRLLYRFYDLQPGQGAIRIDGQDIRDVTQDSLRQAIGVVPQDSVLFNASVKYNIGYGKFGSSTEEIEAAAAAAQMHERILGFPDGYETKVGERGVRLSGGEKQRVAIARTLLKNPPVLLLDEATSALDTGTEKDIQKALQNLVQGRSSLWIAHRLSTIKDADLILVLRDGSVVEQGSHAELLAKGGAFAEMWAEQISGSGSDTQSAVDHDHDHDGDNDNDDKNDQAGGSGNIAQADADADAEAKKDIIDVSALALQGVNAEEVAGYFVQDPQAASELTPTSSALVSPAVPGSASHGLDSIAAIASAIIAKPDTEDSATAAPAEAEVDTDVEVKDAPSAPEPAHETHGDAPSAAAEVLSDGMKAVTEHTEAMVVPEPEAKDQDEAKTQDELKTHEDAPTAVPASSEEPEVEVQKAAAPVAFPTSDEEPETASKPTPSAPAPVAFPTSDDEDEPARKAAPITFPTSDDEPESEPAPKATPAAAPVAFPISDDASIIAPTVREEVASPAPDAVDTPASNTQSPAASPAPGGVTFSPDANPSRDGTPGSAADEPKRRRISSQNFQRLARRISLSGRRQTSGSGSGFQGQIASMIPGLKRNEASQHKQEASEATIATVGSGSGTRATSPPPMTESPAPSVRASEDNVGGSGSPNKLNKKDKKKEKRKTLL